MREISGNSASSGWQGLVAHFGVGQATNIDTVRIEWPSGIVQEMHSIAPKQLLTVLEPPLLRASLTNGTFQLLLTSGIGSSSGIEASTDLAAWTSLGTVTNTTRTMRVADPDAANHRQRFYRVAVMGSLQIECFQLEGSCWLLSLLSKRGVVVIER